MNDHILTPPSSPDSSGPLIFLAGPIQGAHNWQAQAISYIHRQHPGARVANPRREYLDGEFIYEKQVDWETEHLNKAAGHGVILFWLAKETEQIGGRAYAQTSRFEIAEWKARHQTNPNVKIVVGIEEGFSGARYIRHRFSQDCPSVPLVSSLEDACRRAVEML